MKRLKTLLLLATCTCLLGGCGSSKKTIFLDSLAAANTIGGPTSIFDITSKEDFDNYAYNSDAVIVTINEKGFVIDSKSEEIGEFVTFNNKLAESNWPICVRIENEGPKNKFIDLVSNELKEKIDFTVISSNEKIISDIRKANPAVRAALDVSKVEKLNYDESRMLANTLGAHVIVIKQSQISVNDIRRTQTLQKGVWVISDGKTRADCYTAAISGAIGVITSDINKYNDELNRFSFYSAPVLCRPQICVAQRGDSQKYAQNTAAAVESAIVNGADAVKVDFMLTKDNKVVAFDEASTEKSTDGALIVSDSTLSELKKLNVKFNILGNEVDPQPFAAFEDIAAVFQKHPNAILYAEIRTNLDAFAQVFCDLLKQYDLVNRTVLCGFESNILSNKMYEKCHAIIPNIWGLDLMYATVQKPIENIVYKTEHCLGYDCSYTLGSIFDRGYSSFMQHRGYIASYWSVKDKESNISTYINDGFQVMTTTAIGGYGGLSKSFRITEPITSKDVRELYNLEITLYNGTKVESYATLLCSDDDDVLLYITTPFENDNHTYIMRVAA